LTAPSIKIDVDKSEVREKAFGGGLEGAQRTDRETVLWNPSFSSPDQIINSVKPLADARSQDIAQNDGYAAGAVNIHRDNIVGSQYRLIANPNARVLGVSDDYVEEFQEIVEARFNTVADSPDCWLDASRRNTFTGLVRLAVASFVLTGETLSTAEWVREGRRPFNTAIQVITPARLSNPNGIMDDRNLRRGVVINSYGRPTDYWIQAAHPAEWYDQSSIYWKKIPAEKPWGRKMVMHHMEQLLPAQNRGVAEMVAALKQMRMTKKFQEIVLQNAVVNASYAAAIESELPTAQVMELIGATNPGSGGVIEGMNEYIGAYMAGLQSYLSGSKNIAIDGAKIPHLFPGTKLNMQPLSTPGGVGTGFEESLLRHIAACLGLSYEEFSRDYTKTNYSSARASMNNTNKSMQSKKKFIADANAQDWYALWLEEQIAAGDVPLPPGKDRSWFYEPLVKDALIQCQFIGASRGQIDELKETEAAALRIEKRLSNHSVENARLGRDYRETFAQAAREERLMKKLGLSIPEAKPAAPAAVKKDTEEEENER
jgi:lambda family phage portal protein